MTAYAFRQERLNLWLASAWRPGGTVEQNFTDADANRLTKPTFPEAIVFRDWLAAHSIHTELVEVQS